MVLPGKNEWGPGPWADEPDGDEPIEWRDAQTGLLCVARRGPTGSWCGYICLPPSHPAFGLGYDDIDIAVHGGLTYAAIRDDGLYMIGFDTAHYGDYIPAMAVHRKVHYPSDATLEDVSNYRTLGYVKTECASMAAQAEGMFSPMERLVRGVEANGQIS